MQHLKSFLSYKCYSVATIGGISLSIARVIPMPATASPQAQKKNFDYASLDAATSRFVQQQTGEIRALMKRTAQDIIEVGQRLIKVKKKIGHGQFLVWLEAEYDWHRDTANKFMQVAKQFGSVEMSQLSTFDVSALYQLAAPSTPEPARSEAIARAKAGESISYTTAKAIKQKHTSPASKPQPEPKIISQPQPTPTPAALPLVSRPKQEIVAIVPPKQGATLSEATRLISPQPTQTSSVLQLSKLEPKQLGTWWQLSGKHWLYCGDPNSDEFMGRATGVHLLLAFPPNRTWQPNISAEVRIILTEYLPQLHNPDQLDETVESFILLCSRVREVVVSCFLPSPEILSVIHRLDRWAVVAEPNAKRCNAIITDWKKAGLKAERLN